MAEQVPCPLCGGPPPWTFTEALNSPGECFHRNTGKGYSSPLAALENGPQR